MARRGSLVFEEDEDGESEGHDGLRREGPSGNRGRSVSGTLEELWRGVVGSSHTEGAGNRDEERRDEGRGA
jgi:hypothetical protein